MEPIMTRVANVIRAAKGIPTPYHFTTAIIAAAGSSTRMGAEGDKLFRNLRGMPVVLRTLITYQETACIDEIVVVCREEDIPKYEDLRKRYPLDKLTQIVKGGETRQESVLCGVVAANEKAEYFAIADAARGLTTEDMIHRVCYEAYRFGAATAACRAVDTIKTVENGFITGTVERKTVWQAQTPQVFKANLYRAAAYTAKEEAFVATDDNSLIERIQSVVNAKVAFQIEFNN
jgi:2-C-methyl-D-erythritol 4-phosphate cytidylyltransferase